MFYEIKKLYKPFLIFFVMAFLIINWSKVSWVFNYQAVSALVLEIFEKNGQASEAVSEIASATSSQIAVYPETAPEYAAAEYSAKPNSLDIPKLGLVDIPLIINQNFMDSDVYKALDKGVVYYPGGALPGGVGQTVVLGHSAPPNWPKLKYQWVFSKLDSLSPGDEVFVYYNKRKLTYIVTDTVFIHRGEEIPHPDLTKNHNVLVLVSCWPPGKDLHRIAVMAELK